MQHGGAIVGRVLHAHGIRTLFTLCGGHISPILLGAKHAGLAVVDLRDERSAAFAADAASRLTGLPGVCAVTAGPGVTNTVTAVKNAQMAQQPLVVLGGATATVLRGRGSLQDIDQMSIMGPITKWSGRCTKVSEIEPYLERALRAAVEGVPGPVFLEIPVDLLYPRETVAEWYMKESGVEKMTGPVGKAAAFGLRTYLRRQFDMPHLPIPEPPSFPSPFSRLDGQRATVASALAGAKRPVLVIGNQAMVNQTPADAEALAEAVRSIGIPTFLGGSARGLLGRRDPLQFRHQRSAALREADVVLVCGFPFDFRMGYGQGIGRKATLISVNLDPVALRKNRRPTHALETHPGRFLRELAPTVQRGDLRPWFETLRAREDARDAEIAASARTTGERVDPVHLFLRLEEKLSDDAILIVDGGDFVATGAYVLRPRAPLSWLDPGVFGTLGVGGGFAVGAAAARPGTPIWLLYGDGSSAYSLAEFDTCVRHGFAPIAIIGNDASWQQIARDQVVLLGDAVGTTLRRSDYHLVAEGYGGKGLLLDDPARVDAVLDEARTVASAGRPVCINVHLKESDFRKGSLSI